MSIELRPVPVEQLRSWIEAVEAASSSAVDDEVWQNVERTMSRADAMFASPVAPWSAQIF